MSEHSKTQMSSLQLRRRTVPEQPAPVSTIEWHEVHKKRAGESLLRNLAVSAALVLCAVTLRSGTLPDIKESTDVILTAATGQSLLDEQLGKLSFVSTLFPEAVLVFGETNDEVMSQPVSSGTLIRGWTASEPYTSWQSADAEAIAAADGEVMGVYHGYGSEKLVEVLNNDGLTCLYGNLQDVYVQTGDQLKRGQTLGRMLQGESLVFEVRRNGISIDPAAFFDK